jgi:hypothetical protein
MYTRVEHDVVGSTTRFGRKTLIKRPLGKAWLGLESSTNMHLLGIGWEIVNYS